jgi:conjugal transfer pilus assembly protein TraD
VPKELAYRVGPYLAALNRDQRSAVLGIQSRLAILSESTMGTYLQPGEPSIDLRRAMTGGNEVVLFSLNSSRYGKLAAQIAAMAIQDLIAVAGHRLSQANRPLALVAIDEFSALDADNLLNLLARAREAGISVLLSTQEVADLERLAPGFQDQVLGNTAVLLAHRQNVPSSAELIASMVGTKTVWKETFQTDRPRVYGIPIGQSGSTGRGTKREVEEFVIHPNIIKQLPTGAAVLLTKIPGAEARLIRVKPWRPKSGAGHAN